MVSLLARRGGRGRYLARKAYHIAVFSGAVPAQLLQGFWGVVVYGTVLAGSVFVAWRKGPGNPLFDGLARREPGEKEPGRTVLRPLLSTALGGLLGVLMVGDLAIVGYLVCGWGDAAGEAVGHRWGVRRFCPPLARTRPYTKSVEGSIAVLLAGSMGGSTAAVLLGLPLSQALAVGLGAGAVGAIAEGSVGPDTDNLWAQLLPSLMAWFMVG
jgi:dolichol kinase